MTLYTLTIPSTNKSAFMDTVRTTTKYLKYLTTGADWGKKVARAVLSDPRTPYTARCPLNASHVSTSQWPTWKNAHTLNIILDDYKEITSYMFFFLNNI